MSPPRPRNQETDLPDLLDHCVTIGEEVGDILDHSDQRIMVVVPGDLSQGNRISSDNPAFHSHQLKHRDGWGASDRGLVSARRAAAFDDHMEHWVR